MNKDIITSRAEEYKMERDWYIDALDMIESILLEVDTPKSETLLEGKIKRKAGDALRTVFGGGAITGESADRRTSTEEMVMGNPMAHPMAADSVKMPQDLQAGYMHMNRFGSPLPIHGLGTPGRTTMANMMQDQNFMAYHRAIIGNRNPMGMSRIPFGAIA